MLTVKKRTKVFLLIAALFILACGIACGAFYLYADAIRFDYCDWSGYAYADANNGTEGTPEDGYHLSLPFFGNSMTLNEDGGRSKRYIFGASEKNEPVYTVINNVIGAYELETLITYQNRIIADYEVQNDGKTLTVMITGVAWPEGENGESVSVNEKFVFDIENASLDNLPVLIDSTYTFKNPQLIQGSLPKDEG